jgi:hypothetical protein
VLSGWSVITMATIFFRRDLDAWRADAAVSPT